MKQIDKINKELAELHDSYFVAISDNIGEQITTLSFLTEDKKRINIYLKSVYNSRCIDWKFGNIVLDAEIITDKDRIKELIIFIEDLTDMQIKNKKYIELMKKILNKELYIIEINPSYGAYYLGICKDIKIMHI